MTTSTVPPSLRPTTEQIERIRQLSNVIYGEAGAVFTHHAYPSTRQEASNLLRTLHGMRAEDTVDAEEEPMPESQDQPTSEPIPPVVTSKRCSRCKETRPVDEFGANSRTKDGLSYECRSCVATRAKEGRARRGSGLEVNTRRPRSTTTETKAAQPAVAVTPRSEPEPPLSLNGDWRSRFADPTLSQLHQLKAFLGVDTLDETSQITQQIALALSARKEPTP